MKIEQGRHPETTQRRPYAPRQRDPRYVEHFLLKLFEQKNIPDKQDFFFQKKIEKSQKDEKKEKKKLTWYYCNIVVVRSLLKIRTNRSVWVPLEIQKK